MREAPAQRAVGHAPDGTGGELAMHALHPQIAHVAHRGDAVRFAKMLEQRAAGDARRLDEVGKRDRRGEVLVDETARPLDVARREPALDAAQGLAVVVGLEEEQRVEHETFEPRRNQRMAEDRAALGFCGGPVQDPREPAPVPVLDGVARIFRDEAAFARAMSFADSDNVRFLTLLPMHAGVVITE